MMNRSFNGKGYAAPVARKKVWQHDVTKVFSKCFHVDFGIFSTSGEIVHRHCGTPKTS